MSTHLSRHPNAAPNNGEKYGDSIHFPFAHWLNEEGACLQKPIQTALRNYALCVVCGNPRTLKR